MTVELCLVAAVSLNGGIGKNNQIPWHIPEDLVRFKNLTRGHPTIMGRLTYQSIGKALPERPAIVVSKTLESLPDAKVVNSFEEAYRYALSLNPERVFVIGGEAAYSYFLPFADYVYLTHVYLSVPDCDSHFPAIIEHTFTHPRFAVEYTERVVNEDGPSYEYIDYRVKDIPKRPDRIIVTAAILTPQAIVLGARHFDYLMEETINRLAIGDPTEDWIQGFIDNHGVFHDRAEAFSIAKQAGQINLLRDKTGPEGLLFSEDLY